MLPLPAITLSSTPGSVEWSAYPLTSEIRVSNHSGFVLTIVVGGAQYALDPFSADRYDVRDSRRLRYIPSTSVSPATTGTLLVTLADQGEHIPGIYPVHLR